MCHPSKTQEWIRALYPYIPHKMELYQRFLFVDIFFRVVWKLIPPFGPHPLPILQVRHAKHLLSLSLRDRNIDLRGIYCSPGQRVAIGKYFAILRVYPSPLSFSPLRISSVSKADACLSPSSHFRESLWVARKRRSVASKTSSPSLSLRWRSMRRRLLST